MEVASAETYKETVLKGLSLVPIATTQQIGKLFDCSQPNKKASSILKQLERENAVEWERIDMRKIWRLTPKMRRSKGILFPRTSSMNHTLMISDLLFTLHHHGLKRFEFEPRYPWNEKVYAPDALISYRGKAYLLEIQIEPLSRKRWAAKWSNANLFFNERHFEQVFKEKYGKLFIPHFLCISNQSPSIVKEGFEVKDRELIVVKHIRDLST